MAWEFDDNGVDPEWQELDQSGTVVQGGTKLEQLANVSVPEGEAQDQATIIYDFATKLWTPQLIDVVSGVLSFNGRAGIVVPQGNDYSLGLLSDVDLVPPPNNGDAIIFNSTSGNWEAGPAGNVISVFGRTGIVIAQNGDYTLTQMGDVDTTGAAPGDALVYNGATWLPGTPVSAISDLTDVNTAGVSPGDLLAWNSGAGEWQPITISPVGQLDDLSDVTIGGVPVTTGQVLINNGVGQFINEILAAAQVKNTPAGDISATDVQAALNELDTDKAPVSHTHTANEAQAEPIPTALVDGGNILIDGLSATTVIIEAGSGFIVDYYNDYENPTSELVTWPQQTVSLLNPGTERRTYFRVISGGTIVTQNTPPTPTSERTSIHLGFAFHDLELDDPPIIFNNAHKAGHTAEALIDLVDFTGPLVKGFDPIPNANLTYGHDGGEYFDLGINEDLDNTNPNILTVAPLSTLTWYYFTGDGTLQPGATQTLDPGNYDPGGVGPAPVGIPGSGARASIQYYFLQAPGIGFKLYGQDWYADLETAKLALRDDFNSLVIPSVVDGWLGPIYAVVATKGATDLSDPTEAEIFKLLDGIGGGGGGGAPGAVTSVFARIGDVVAQDGDYSLGQMGDVDLTTPPTDQQVLTYIDASGNWEPRDSQGGGGGAGLHIGETPPVDPVANPFWWDTSQEDAALFIYYDNAGNPVWVPTTPQSNQDAVGGGWNEVDVTGANDSNPFILDFDPNDEGGDFEFVLITSNSTGGFKGAWSELSGDHGATWNGATDVVNFGEYQAPSTTARIEGLNVSSISWNGRQPVVTNSACRGTLRIFDALGNNGSGRAIFDVSGFAVVDTGGWANHSMRGHVNNMPSCNALRIRTADATQTISGLLRWRKVL